MLFVCMIPPTAQILFINIYIYSCICFVTDTKFSLLKNVMSPVVHSLWIHSHHSLHMIDAAEWGLRVDFVT